QVHRSLDHVRDVAPRIGADRLDALTALTEHDLTLALALDVDRLLDSSRSVLELLPDIGLDRRLIWQLLMQAQIELLARDLGRQLPQRRVGDLVGGIVPWSFRHMPGKPRLDIADAIAAERRDHESRAESRARVGRLGDP